MGNQLSHLHDVFPDLRSSASTWIVWKKTLMCQKLSPTLDWKSRTRMHGSQNTGKRTQPYWPQSLCVEFVQGTLCSPQLNRLGMTIYCTVRLVKCTHLLLFPQRRLDDQLKLKIWNTLCVWELIDVIVWYMMKLGTKKIQSTFVLWIIKLSFRMQKLSSKFTL